MNTQTLIINTDGASRGNPGLAAIGVIIKDEQGRLLASISRAIGNTTNNQSEYQAIIAALEQAQRIGASNIVVRSDSELVVRQLNGQYRVKKATLKPLYQRIKQLQSQFVSCTFIHINRHQNREADQLANQALA